MPRGSRIYDPLFRIRHHECLRNNSSYDFIIASFSYVDFRDCLLWFFLVIALSRIMPWFATNITRTFLFECSLIIRFEAVLLISLESLCESFEFVSGSFEVLLLLVEILNFV
ncbi:hypothetical protein IHE45_05G125900 [Dioscorea alata]|uniref:Uncharacterized protein n=2 Tax=Dioscorea alata TaxID=55571 RepID=A0ACB7W4B8_DIOAL|nr:hypothetical protein IHE45_19G121400 [Dioscorea alata]KAH7682504.1 hypothetical protein IHE45_05G125900 [Dioscorea alata]